MFRFPIGFRQMRLGWHHDLPSMLQWAGATGFEAIDLRQATVADVRQVQEAGLQLGTVDLLDMGRIVDADKVRRREVERRNVRHIHELASAGVKTFLTVLMPDDPACSRKENYVHAVEALAPLADTARAAGARIAIEGWPGRAPHYPGIVCTPQTFRALLRDTDARAIGINYDPSHLIRLGIDPLRFLDEFASHIVHVHAKDTLLFPDAACEFDQQTPATFAPPHTFGEHTWRYTIPGRGQADWRRIATMLDASGYRGPLSIELEDADFHGSRSAKRRGCWRQGISCGRRSTRPVSPAHGDCE